MQEGGEMSMQYNFVFVILVYRNTKDLMHFFATVELNCAKVVVVNSYYDQQSELEFKNIAMQNGADYISVPNKGYGYGNNRGIEYAIKNYRFKYLIVSNADIEIKKISIEDIENYQSQIIAPKIKSLNGKLQNPNVPFEPFKLEEKLQYLCYKKDKKKAMYIFYALSRLKKILYNLFVINKKGKKIYSAHGCFVIFPASVLCKLYPVYDENVFLFNEELHLARKAKMHNIATIYLPNIEILHFEDGSVSFMKQKVFSLMRDSYMKYYEYWNK